VTTEAVSIGRCSMFQPENERSMARIEAEEAIVANSDRAAPTDFFTFSQKDKNRFLVNIRV